MNSAKVLAAFIRENKRASRVIVTGYADPRGSDEYNQILSEKRAQTIANFLRNNNVSIQIESQGKGETQPPATLLENLTQQEQWARWRRVELELIYN